MDPNENNIVDFEQLIQVTYHIKAALLLMNELQNSTINYVELLHLTMFLLLSSPIKMKITEKSTYTGYHDSVFNTIESVIATSDDSNYITINNEDYYEIPDMIYGQIIII